jgi:hypothetical protein
MIMQVVHVVITVPHTVKVDLQEIGYEGIDWIQLAQDWVKERVLVNTVMSIRLP